MTGKRTNSRIALRPGNFLRARTYPAGTPISSATATSAIATSKVTLMESASPGVFQAWLNQEKVKPAGSQPPPQEVDSAVTITEASTESSVAANRPATSQVSTAVTVGRRRVDVGGGAAGAGARVAAVIVSPSLQWPGP